METTRDPEDILASEVDWFYFGSGTNLVSILDFRVEKRRSADGPPTDDLDLPEEPEYYICWATNLLLDEELNLSVEPLILVYGAEFLLGCGQGPQAVPDSYTWAKDGHYSVDLSGQIEDAVVEALIDDIDQRNECLLKILASKDDPEAFIRSITNEKLLEKLIPYWEANKENWV